jgi:hypothetical protein
MNNKSETPHQGSIHCKSNFVVWLGRSLDIHSNYDMGHGRHLKTNRNCLSFPRTGVNDIHSNYDMGHGGHLITNRNCLSFPRTGVNDIHSNYDMGHGGHLITNRNCLSFPRIGVNAPVFGWSPCCSSC